LGSSFFLKKLCAADSVVVEDHVEDLAVRRAVALAVFVEGAVSLG
jgi:hypothetical protein